MRFGIGPIAIHLSRDFSEVEELVLLAENEGFDSVWLRGASADVAIACAAIAATTRWIRIGAVVPIGHVHPLAIAEEIATLDNIASGRIEVILMPAGDSEFGRRPVEPSDVGARIAESIEVIARALEPLPLALDGRFFPVPALLPGNDRRTTSTVVVMPRPVHDVELFFDSRLLDAVALAAHHRAGLFVDSDRDVAEILAMARNDSESARHTLPRLATCRAIGAAGTCIDQLERLRELGTSLLIANVTDGDIATAKKRLHRLSTEVVPHFRTAAPEAAASGS